MFKVESAGSIPLTVPRPLPPELESRYQAWDKIARQSSIFHDVVAITAVAGPVLFAALGKEYPFWGAGIAALSAISAAALARVKPNSARIAYRRAWRILDDARHLYMWGFKDLAYVIACVRKAERVVERMQMEFAPGADDYRRRRRDTSDRKACEKDPSRPHSN